MTDRSLRDNVTDALARADTLVDGVRRRVARTLGTGRPGHIAAYRGWGDAARIDVIGRVLEGAPEGGPGESDTRWDNLVATFRRFESDEVPGVALALEVDGHRVETTTDDEGYYTATLPGPATVDGLWADIRVSLRDGGLATPQPVMVVPADATLGVISDIDDTVLDSSITDWKTAAQLTFLHNARTRKPLAGVAALYRAFQQGAGARAPIFYVSSSPWNLYDLLEEFMSLNGIPPGPVFLRDLGIDTGKFVKTAGHGHKLERTRELIRRFPHLRWVLLGDSGQADAELYAEAATEFGDRIAAIYIRDVDPDRDSPFDTAVDAYIERIAGTRVPMLRARDSRAIAEHAASLGLLPASTLDAIAREAGRDAARPTLAEAAVEGAIEGGPEDGSDGPPPRVG